MKRQGDAVRQSVVVAAVLLAALFLLPLAVVRPSQGDREEDQGDRSPVREAEPLPPFVSGVLDGERTLRVLAGETVEEMDLGTYLVGVVRAEMPASFELEALRAQAVAARTYTLYKLRSGGNHGETADICTDPSCCQAYLDEARAAENWGADAPDYETKVREAVSSTDGQAILYNGQPVLAVFHAASAGRTRAAGTVWLQDLPYLQAVDSPEEGAGIPNYYSRVEFSADQFREKVLASCPEADLSGDMGAWLTDAVKDSAGSVDTIKVGGVEMKGARLRSILGLRSACFDWEVQGETWVFFVTGHGHGVGMSQYGANAMAKAGSTYKKILTHYYTGVSIGPAP